MIVNSKIVYSKIRKPSFFFIIAIVGLFAVLIGFGKTFIVPVAEGRFSAPVVIHIHGAFAFSWILLFLIQTSLIHFRKYRIHQLLGILGFFISVGVMITIVSAEMNVVKRELDRGVGEPAYSTLIGSITSALIFFSLVLTGILKRNNSESHKRFMLLATIVVLWPAWFRFRHYFPSVPRPDIWFAIVLADSLILFSWVWDRIKNGRIHPVLKYSGSFIILEHTFEVLAFDTAAWRYIAKWTYYIL